MLALKERAIYAAMPNSLADRIQQRLDALGLSARAASRAAGGSDSTIRNILTGASESPRLDTVRKLAKILQVSESWLATGEDGPTGMGEPSSEFTPAPVVYPQAAEMPKDVPVMGTAQGAIIDTNVEGFSFFGADPVDYVRRPPALLNVREAYAIYVSGDSMAPMHPHGELRFVHPGRPISSGDTVVVRTKAWEHDPGQGYIKILRRRRADTVVLEQLNPEVTFELPVRHIQSVHRVLTMNELFGV